MRYFVLLLLTLGLLSGCAKKEEVANMRAVAEMLPPPPPPGKARSYLAYEHAITVDVEDHKLAAAFEAGQKACREMAAEHCTILESRLSTGRDSSGQLKLRATPAGIRKMIAALGRQSTISEQSTTAEDLAAPITDGDKKLAMLKDYRQKLEALHGRAANDVDALIKVNRELAQVQSQLEELEGTQAKLMQRVETEVLTVLMRPAQSQVFWKPIQLAVADFGGNLSQGISSAITGIALILPWIPLVVFSGWVGLALWRRWRRR